MKRILSFISIFVLLLCLQGCIFYSTGETEVGVRTKKLALFGKKGVEDKVYEPGLFEPKWADWWGTSRIQRLP